LFESLATVTGTLKVLPTVTVADPRNDEQPAFE